MLLLLLLHTCLACEDDPSVTVTVGATWLAAEWAAPCEVM